MMQFIYDDGGRSKYFKAKDVRDCVTRAICNATGKDYKEVYDILSKMSKKKYGESARNGVYKDVWKKYLKQLENEKVLRKITCCEIGSRNKVHLTEEELPTRGNYIVQCAHHLTCIKNGKLYDTWDCQINEFTEEPRLVYAMWKVI